MKNKKGLISIVIGIIILLVIGVTITLVIMNSNDKNVQPNNEDTSTTTKFDEEIYVNDYISLTENGYGFSVVYEGLDIVVGDTFDLFDNNKNLLDTLNVSYIVKDESIYNLFFKGLKYTNYSNTEYIKLSSSKVTESEEETMFNFYAFGEEMPLNITVDDFLKKGWHTQIDYMTQKSKPGEEYTSLSVEKDGEREKTGKADGLNLSIKNNTDTEQLVGGCSIWSYKTTMGSTYNINLGNGISLSSTLKEVEEKCGIPTNDKWIYKSKDGNKVEYTYFSKDETKRLDIECRDGKVFYIKLYSLVSVN